MGTNRKLYFKFTLFFDSEDNFDDSYAQKQDNDSIYEGNKELYILEVNESMTFKNLYFNIEEKIASQTNNNENNEAKSKKGTKTNITSKTSTKKIEDNSIVIHNSRNSYSKRKSARFKGIVPDNGNKIVNILRNDSKSGTMRVNLKDNEE